jgi:mannose-6-phosphate isomerase-like protein (cupin superfamily)
MLERARERSEAAERTVRRNSLGARVCELDAFSVDYVEVDAGARETLIVHEECDEAWYMLDGELEAILADESHIVRAGEWVRVPRGLVHGSRNLSDATAHLLVVNAPPWHPAFDHDAAE